MLVSVHLGTHLEAVHYAGDLGIKEPCEEVKVTKKREVSRTFNPLKACKTQLLQIRNEVKAHQPGGNKR